ncbi:hypothetical protein [Flavobacterium gilvum]|uniref:Uncharacterized protein n=1 Tax=Flavobacterium gilvum TaxID=1492737 RepID=A0AAC9N5J5_9FLAO|nr:hypothetical protein [Flavobacterium gilvum]AOW09492.1 hypothetical protein EM308_08270 [Flavobacterium gilvum]KFC59996.1 hypothetical protein FEM08_11750 [Flavobacterium gilvum]
MTSTFLKNKGNSFFNGKKAKVLVKQRNLGGDEIQKNEEVEIICKNRDCNVSLDIKSSTGIIISRVWCEQLELIKDDSN